MDVGGRGSEGGGRIGRTSLKLFVIKVNIALMRGYAA